MFWLLKINAYLCIRVEEITRTGAAGSARLINTMKMKNAFDFTDDEVLAIFNKALNELSFEEKQEKKRNNIRKGKADFCNLKEQEIIFIAE